MLPPTHEKSLEVYFREINRYPLLTRAVEVGLALRIHAGDERALQSLVSANLRFVVSVAKRYLNQGLSLPDLINEGNLGLLKAARRFDETRGFKFISYAVWWIRQSILQALLDQARTVRLPQNQTALLIKINRARHALQTGGALQPDPQQIAEYLGRAVDEIRTALSNNGTDVALDDCGDEDGERSLAESLVAENQPAPDERLFERGLRADVRRSLSVLTSREAEVIVLYFGLGSDDALTLEQIGQRLGLTRERIRQIKQRALEKMRGAVGRELLFDYY
jgi:RNA polymerase primary sigma factor